MNYVLPLVALLASPAHAQTAEAIAQLEVLPGWQTASGTQVAGFRISLLPGWKTYWRAPGDSGIPPQLDLSSSDNVSTAEFIWPVPQVFDQNGMRSIGYQDQVVIPLEIAPINDRPMRLSGTIDIGVCEEICIPVRLNFDATLPQDGRRDPAIVAALVNRPLQADEAGLTTTHCVIRPADIGLSVTVTMGLPHTGGDEIVVIETADPQIWVSEAEVSRQGATITASADIVHMTQDAFALDRNGLRFTVLGRDHAVDIHGCSAG